MRLSASGIRNFVRPGHIPTAELEARYKNIKTSMPSQINDQAVFLLNKLKAQSLEGKAKKAAKKILNMIFKGMDKGLSRGDQAAINRIVPEGDFKKFTETFMFTKPLLTRINKYKTKLLKKQSIDLRLPSERSRDLDRTISLHTSDSTVSSVSLDEAIPRDSFFIPNNPKYEERTLEFHLSDYSPTGSQYPGPSAEKISSTITSHSSSRTNSSVSLGVDSLPGSHSSNKTNSLASLDVNSLASPHDEPLRIEDLDSPPIAPHTVLPQLVPTAPSFSGESFTAGSHFEEADSISVQNSRKALQEYDPIYNPHTQSINEASAPDTLRQGLNALATGNSPAATLEEEALQTTKATTHAQLENSTKRKKPANQYFGFENFPLQNRSHLAPVRPSRLTAKDIPTPIPARPSRSSESTPFTPTLDPILEEALQATKATTHAQPANQYFGFENFSLQNRSHLAPDRPTELETIPEKPLQATTQTQKASPASTKQTFTDDCIDIAAGTVNLVATPLVQLIKLGKFFGL